MLLKVIFIKREPVFALVAFGSGSCVARTVPPPVSVAQVEMRGREALSNERTLHALQPPAA